MGTWGYGIFDDDLASDIRMDFEEAFENGERITTITKTILEEYAEADPEVAPTVYLVLAALQIEHNRLQPKIRDKALEIIDSGQGLETWEEAGSEELHQRKQVLEELKSNLLTYQKKKRNSAHSTKKKSPKIKPKVGDVFAIKVDDTRFCYGQISTNTCYIIFDIVAEEHPPLDEIIRRSIVFMTYSNSLSIEDGDWPIIGNSPVPAIHFPEYVVAHGDTYMVMNHTLEVLRPASPYEIENLSHHTSYTSNVLELAVRAKFGTGEWYPFIDDLFYRGSKQGK